MTEVFVIGSYSSVFGKRPDVDHKDLAAEAFDGVHADAGLIDGTQLSSVWFSSFGMHAYGQGGIPGQVCLTDQINRGDIAPFTPIYNIENGCASGAFALNGAWKDIKSGESHLCLVLGLEKLTSTDTAFNAFDILAHGIDQIRPAVWQDYYREAAEQAGKTLEFSEGRSMFMDTYATQAAYHMQKYGTTQRQIAMAAAKTHNFGADNPRAQYRFRMTPDEVLQDREVSFPLTRAMCSPIGDGAAALLLCSGDFLRDCSAAVRDRAVRVRASAGSGGRYRDLDQPSLTRRAAELAYRAAQVSPEDIDVAEVHDATTFSEIYQAEMMGFCPEGEGGRLIESGATHLGGHIPMNTSGGLISKGHPIGATGVSMVAELVEQLRGEAGPRQVENARLALAENGGGIMGFDEAACAVTILERA